MDRAGADALTVMAFKGWALCCGLLGLFCGVLWWLDAAVWLRLSVGVVGLLCVGVGACSLWDHVFPVTRDGGPDWIKEPKK